jgi:hypothetical protein
MSYFFLRIVVLLCLMSIEYLCLVFVGLSPSLMITYTLLVERKSDVISYFKIFHKIMHTQFGNVVKIVCSNYGEEYLYRSFQSYFSKHGVIHQTSCVNAKHPSKKWGH